MAFKKRPRLSLCLICLSPLLFAISAHAQNPKDADNQQLIKALLEEVRLLRQAFQRMNLNAYRGQILIERIRAQNEKVTRLSHSLEEARDEVVEMQTSTGQFNERIKVMDSRAQQEADEKSREQLVETLKEMKSMVEVYKQREQRSRERELKLSEQLRSEQSKLDEFENRLDMLEREIQNELAKQETENTKREGRKP
jgi:chromosome segregation ATPase